MQEVPLYPLWVTLFLTMWAVIGPIVGIVAGHFLTRSWQRQQWLLDNKKEEYRETLTALSTAYLTLTRLNVPGVAIPAELYEQLRQAEFECLRVLRDRIFIVDELRSANIINSWIEATTAVDSDHDLQRFRTRFDAITKKIITLASQTKS